MPKKNRPSLPTNMVPVPEGDRKGFTFDLPGRETHVGACHQSWQKWADYHKALGQELAKRMREYGGPAEQDEPPPGGTPVAMRMAA